MKTESIRSTASSRSVGLGYVSERPNKLGYYVFSGTRNGVRTVKYSRNRRELFVVQREWVRQPDQPKGSRAKVTLTVEEYLESWLDKLRQNPKGLGVKLSTTEHYAMICRYYVIPEIGHIKLTALTPEHILDMLETQAQRATRKGEPMRHTAVNKTLAVLRSALARAVRDKLLASNPAKDEAVKPIKGPKHKGQALNHTQQTDFLTALPGHPLEVLFTLMLGLGLRAGEALGLTWRDIDFAGRELWVRKTLKHRRVINADGTVSRVPYRDDPKTIGSADKLPLIPDMLTMLQAHRAARKVIDPNGYMFTTSTGTPYLLRNIEREFAGVLARAGLPAMPLHSLRHSTASYLFSKKVPLPVVMAITRHKNARTLLEIYATPTDEDIREALEATSPFKLVS